RVPGVDAEAAARRHGAGAPGRTAHAGAHAAFALQVHVVAAQHDALRGLVALHVGRGALPFGEDVDVASGAQAGVAPGGHVAAADDHVAAGRQADVVAAQAAAQRHVAAGLPVRGGGAAREQAAAS